MLTKKQLESVHAIRRRIERDEAELKELEEDSPCDVQALSLSLNPSHSNFPRGIDGALASYIDKKNRYRQRILDRRRYLIGLLEEIDKFIASLEDPQEQEIVELRCKECLTFEEIGIRTSWSPTTVKRHYYQAVCKLSYQNGRNGR